MAKYRQVLPQLQHRFFMTDGGLETTLIYHDHYEVPCFAAFLLLKSAQGRQSLRRYFSSYAELARQHDIGVILETATWRANPYWGRLLGYSLDELEQENRSAVSLLVDIRQQYESARTPIVISGCIGPLGDGYVADERMSVEEAQDYHDVQIRTFAATAADLVTALTLTYVDEAIGIARVAKRFHIPVVISFTVETDGRLPSGQRLSAAIQQVDRETQFYPAYYMINCAHPQHFKAAVSSDEIWVKRIRGIRANASTLSHAELNDCQQLDEGDPVALAESYYRLLEKQLIRVNIVGGCCGTDTRHVDAMVSACLPIFLRRDHSALTE